MPIDSKYINTNDIRKRVFEEGVQVVKVFDSSTSQNRTIYIKTVNDSLGNPYLAWSFDNITWRPFA